MQLSKDAVERGEWCTVCAKENCVLIHSAPHLCPPALHRPYIPLSSPLPPSIDPCIGTASHCISPPSRGASVPAWPRQGSPPLHAAWPRQGSPPAACIGPACQYAMLHAAAQYPSYPRAARSVRRLWRTPWIKRPGLGLVLGRTSRSTGQGPVQHAIHVGMYVIPQACTSHYAPHTTHHTALGDPWACMPHPPISSPAPSPHLHAAPLTGILCGLSPYLFGTHPRQRRSRPACLLQHGPDSRPPQGD